MAEQLKQFIEKYVDLLNADWDLINKHFVKQEFTKNELILVEGKICSYFYFIEQGLVRFYCNTDGVEITKSFVVAPYCFTSKISFRNQSPAAESIQAIEKTVVWRIGLYQYKEFEKINVWNIFMRKLLNEIQEYTEKRMLELKTLTAEKNYQNLLNQYPPTLMQKLPLKYLASFLGVAPQSLSRIRNNVFNNKKS